MNKFQYITGIEKKLRLNKKQVILLIKYNDINGCKKIFDKLNKGNK